LEQLKALKLYFQAEHLIDNKTSDLYLRVSNPTFELYLNFLDFVLPILSSLNKLFQHEKPQIYHLYSKMASAYKTILDCYMQSNYLEKTDLEKVQYRNPQYFLKNDKIYVGGKCMALLSETDCKVSGAEKKIFFTNCLNFYVECSKQIFQRFPFHSPQIMCLKYLSFLNPKEIKNTMSIAPAANYFENILELNLNDIDREWRQLKKFDFDFEQVNIIKFWKSVRDTTNCDGLEFFPLINKFVAYILILPHSTACV